MNIECSYFAYQMDYDGDVVEKLREMAQFLLLLYVPAWLRAPVAADAPLNDLSLCKNMLQYRQVNQNVSEAARVVIKCHVWYLKPPLAVLSLFSDRVTVATVLRGSEVRDEQEAAGDPEDSAPTSISQ